MDRFVDEKTVKQMLETKAIIRKAVESGSLSEKEGSIATDAWAATEQIKLNEGNNRRIEKFINILAQSFGPGRSKEIHGILTTQTKVVKEEIEAELKMQRQKVNNSNSQPAPVPQPIPMPVITSNMIHHPPATVMHPNTSIAPIHTMHNQPGNNNYQNLPGMIPMIPTGNVPQVYPQSNYPMATPIPIQPVQVSMPTIQVPATNSKPTKSRSNKKQNQETKPVSIQPPQQQSYDIAASVGNDDLDGKIDESEDPTNVFVLSSNELDQQELISKQDLRGGSRLKLSHNTSNQIADTPTNSSIDWKSSFILDKQKLLQCVHKTLNSDISISEAVLGFLSKAIQQHLYDILEAAISMNRWKNNSSSKQFYFLLSKQMNLFKNDPSLETILCNQAGMQWGPQTSKVIANDLNNIQKNIIENYHFLTSEISKKLIDLDDVKQGLQSTNTSGKANKRKSAQISEETIISDELQDETNGKLCCEDLAMLHLKMELIDEYKSLQPDSTSGLTPKRSKGAKNSSSNSFALNPNSNSTNMALSSMFKDIIYNESNKGHSESEFPFEGDLPTTAAVEIDCKDICNVLSKYAIPKRGGKFSRDIGTTLTEYKLCH